MTFRKRIAGTAAIGAALLLGAALCAAPARADYVVTLTEMGSNVASTGSGTIDTADLTLSHTGSTNSGISPLQRE
ncbi:MAG: hypothetical protein ACREFY_21745 [Acetobacteraceae bacterium]